MPLPVFLLPGDRLDHIETLVFREQLLPSECKQGRSLDLEAGFLEYESTVCPG